MIDLIERQMAIALVVNDMNHRVDISEDTKEYLFGLRTRLWQLPSANVADRPRGEWIEAREYDPCYWICSECKRQVDIQENFCPNCGADMRGDCR